MTALLGKVAVVTGATRGIGRAIALELATQGCDVAFNYMRSEAQAAELEGAIGQLGRQALGLRADVSSFEEVKAFFEQVVERFGTVHYLINNAGITRDRALMNLAPEQWQEVIDTNLTGAYNCSRSAIVTLMKQREGAIVNISSASGLIGLAGQVNYAASKAGMIGMTRALAKEVARFGITVNAVAPGFIDTDMIAELPQKVQDQVLKQIPMARLGDAREVALTVSFLLSEGGRYITGQVVAVDGGLTA